MIIIPGELLGELDDSPVTRVLSFLALDEGTVLNGLCNQGTPGSLPGTLCLCPRGQRMEPVAAGRPGDAVCIIAYPKQQNGRPDDRDAAAAQGFVLCGYVLAGDRWKKTPVQAVPVGEELRSRSRGLLETNILSKMSVFQAGGGSGGSPILIELAKCGVGNFYLMDHDRLEVANIWRHTAGLRDVGRYKTRFLAEAIRQKNPDAKVHAWEERVSWENESLIRDNTRKADLVISGVDDPTAIVVLNRICVAENKPLIVGGAFRRAYGGQVLVVTPRVTPCYECFRRSLPQAVLDREVSNEDQARRIAYSDRPVSIEPGLSNDIAPISTMMVKLALQKLLKDKSTTLQSLNEDLVAPWYLWLNRRESGTDYEKLDPLGFNLDGMHILRWYGIDMKRRPDCPCCGDFVGVASREEGIELGDLDAAEFAS